MPPVVGSITQPPPSAPQKGYGETGVISRGALRQQAFSAANQPSSGNASANVVSPTSRAPPPRIAPSVRRSTGLGSAGLKMMPHPPMATLEEQAQHQVVSARSDWAGGHNNAGAGSKFAAPATSRPAGYHRRSMSDQTASSSKIAPASSPSPPPAAFIVGRGGRRESLHPKRVAKMQSKADGERDAGGGKHGRSAITVAVRRRPRRLIEGNETDVVTVESTTSVAVFEPKLKVDLTKYVEPSMFHFDNAFGEDISNEDIYEQLAKPLLETVFYGGNALVFAFGQTGSGKTHTMLGGNGIDGRQQPGIYELACRDLLADIDQMNRATMAAATDDSSSQNGSTSGDEGGASTTSLYIAYYEIYNSKLYDLLNGRKKIVTREDDRRNVHLVGLTEHRITSVEALSRRMADGTMIRASGATGANDRSSRSHAILTIFRRKGTSNCGKMSFVDLAGSERAADTKEADKKTRQEGAEINKSLLALKECIRSLDLQTKHVPFRGSKLTEILRDSFLGRCATCMIANVSPCKTHCEDTLNTLRYADRVKSLRAGDAGTFAPQCIACNLCGEMIDLESKVPHSCPKQYVLCPHCGVQLDLDKLETHAASCTERPVGCDQCGQMVTLGGLKGHRKKCGRVLTTCPNCGVVLERDMLGRHQANECPYGVVPCLFCKFPVQRQQMDEHRLVCDQQPVACDFCSIMMKRGKLEAHLRVCVKRTNAVRMGRQSLIPIAGGGLQKKDSNLNSELPRYGGLQKKESNLNIDMANRRKSLAHLNTALQHPRPAHERQQQPQQSHPSAALSSCSKCSMAVAAGEMDGHVKNNCPKAAVKCPFGAAGCTAHVLRGEVDAHLEAYMSQHLLLLQKQSQSLQLENDKLRRQVREGSPETSHSTTGISCSGDE